MAHMNTLYYGDNLDVLRRHIAGESVDLVYLDPPFKSDQNYNILFAEQDGSRSAAQIQVFEDTWRWDEAAAAAFQEVVETGGRVSLTMQGFRSAIGDNDLLAYLSMMAPRLVELRRVLKPTGSIFLHCDSTASHYLKMLMDAVFGPDNFRNEIAWKRSTAKGHSFTRFPRAQDTIFYYAKSDKPKWHSQYVPHSEERIAKHYNNVEEGTGRRYTLGDCLNPNPDRPNLTYEWKGITRVWRWTHEKMEALDRVGRLIYTRSGMPRFKRYLDEMPGTPVTSVWTDISPINARAAERLGYPTQKPLALLERIISASSDEGDVVLDPFCGCGTTIAAAQELKREWIGIDITNLAISLIKHRLQHAYGESVSYDVIGEPVSESDARQLAKDDPYQFQWWALGLVGARPVEQKKGADKGIDGRLFFHDEAGKTKQVVLSVKAGKLQAVYVRDLRGVIERENAELGVLLSLESPTKKMRAEAASAGFYESTWTDKKHPRMQLITVGELLDGKGIDMPPIRHTGTTFKKAKKAKRKPTHRQKKLGE